MRLSVQTDPFDMGRETAAFQLGAAGAGAIVTFCGLVRGEAGRLAAMEIEHYPGMTEKAVGAMMEAAATRFHLIDTLVIHRFGRLSVGEAIMMVATAAPHRSEAFQAAEFLMDFLKSRAPFWKKEIRPDGRADWVNSRGEDEAALGRW